MCKVCWAENTDTVMPVAASDGHTMTSAAADDSSCGHTHTVVSVSSTVTCVDDDVRQRELIDQQRQLQ